MRRWRFKFKGKGKGKRSNGNCKSKGYGQPEYTTKDYLTTYFTMKLKMSFMVFNMKKEETQMSYHMVHGQERQSDRIWSCWQ